METREKNIKILCSIYIKVVFTKKGKCGKITVCHFPKLILKKNQVTIQKAYFGFPQQSCLTVDQKKNKQPEKKMGNFKPKEQQKQLIRPIFPK